jgi:hypothetical protein
MKDDAEIPAILKKPITLTIEALWASVFIKWGSPEVIRENNKLQAAAHDLINQFNERIAAACILFGIDIGKLGENLCPVIYLIIHSFPDAFRAVEQGQPKRRRKNGTAWDVFKKLDLLRWVDQCVESGVSERQACYWYAVLSEPRLNHDNVIQRHQEAKGWRQNMSTFDQLEILRVLRGSDETTT